MFEKSVKACCAFRQPIYNRSVLWCVIDVGETRCAVVSVHLDIDIYTIGLTPGGSKYTFTHKQYTEQHSETEYTECYIHNSKNTQLNRNIQNIQPYIK
jgi:hypothetical protein